MPNKARAPPRSQGLAFRSSIKKVSTRVLMLDGELNFENFSKISAMCITESLIFEYFFQKPATQ